MVDETASELVNEIGAASSDLHAPAPTPAPRQAPVAEPAAPSATAPQGGAEVEPVVIQGAAQVPSAERTPVAQPAPEVARHGVKPGPERAAQTAASPHAAKAISARVPVKRHPDVSVINSLVCVVDSTADYLKAGLLASAFKGFPSLPRVVAVHPGVQEDLEIEGLASLGLPLPDAAVHLGVSEPSFASQSARILQLFDALLTELEPRAVAILGSSNSDLACGLLAHKRGVRLVQTGSGRRGGSRAEVGDTNAVLVERLCDVLYTDSAEDFYALFREGIRLDRVHSMGSLSREMLDLALSALRDAHTSLDLAHGIDPWVLSQPHGMIAIDPGSVSTASMAQLVALSRELPLLWPMRSNLFSRFSTSGLAEQVKGTRISAMPSQGFLQSLDLLRNSTCLVACSEGEWLDEAKLLGVPTRVFVGSPRHMLGAQTATSRSPEYWDTGTALRIAKHLIHWFAADSPESTPVPDSAALASGTS
ncbi:MAG: UDP-N-acetylglucosamine 2-epimerase [Gemmatimonas sp.]